MEVSAQAVDEITYDELDQSGVGVPNNSPTEGWRSAIQRISGLRITEWDSRITRLGGLAPSRFVDSARSRFDYYVFDAMKGEPDGDVFVWIASRD